MKDEKVEMELTHPISILKEEHEVILENLNALEVIAEKVSTSENFRQIVKELDGLEKISHTLINAENHHKREEEALFPLLEEKGITGPPSIMRLEHKELREEKGA